MILKRAASFTMALDAAGDPRVESSAALGRRRFAPRVPADARCRPLHMTISLLHRLPRTLLLRLSEKRHERVNRLAIGQLITTQMTVSAPRATSRSFPYPPLGGPEMEASRSQERSRWRRLVGG